MHRRIHSRPNQIAECLVCGVGYPHRRQIAGPMKDCQLLRVAAVGLDPLTGLAWNHRRCSHSASMSQDCELPVDAIPAATRLIAEVQLSMAGEPLGHLSDIVGCVWDDSQEADRPVPAVFRNADRYGRLMDVQAD